MSYDRSCHAEFFYFMTKLNRHVSLLATTFILNKNNKQKDLKKPQIFIKWYYICKQTYETIYH